MLLGWLLQNQALDLKNTKPHSRLKTDVTGLFLRAHAHLPQAQTHLLWDWWSLVCLPPFSVAGALVFRQPHGHRHDNSKSPLQQTHGKSILGAEQPWSTTKTAWQQHSPAGLCHWGRAVTSLPPLLALVDTHSSCHLGSSCRTRALKLSRSALPGMGFPVQLKSLQTDGPSKRQSLSSVTHLKVCTPVAFKDIEVVDNGDNYAEV